MRSLHRGSGAVATILEPLRSPIVARFTANSRMTIKQASPWPPPIEGKTQTGSLSQVEMSLLKNKKNSYLTFPTLRLHTTQKPCYYALMDQPKTNFYSIALKVLIQVVSLVLGLASSIWLSISTIMPFITAFEKYGVNVLNPNFNPPPKPEFFVDFSDTINSLLTHITILLIPMTFLFFIPIHLISKKTLSQFPQKNAHKHMLITASILAAIIFLLGYQHNPLFLRK